MTPIYDAIMSSLYAVSKEVPRGDGLLQIRHILDHRVGRLGVIYLVVIEGRKDEEWVPEWRVDYRSIREYFIMKRN